MILYMKQHIFTWGDKFSIYDEAGNEQYYVEGEVLTWGKKLHLYDLNRREIAFIRQRLLTLPPKYEILQNDQIVAELAKKFTFFRHEYKVNGPDWKGYGDYTGHDYEITENDRCVAHISRAWFTLGDAYRIDIDDSVDEVLTLAVVLGIDAAIEAERNSH